MRYLKKSLIPLIGLSVIGSSCGGGTSASNSSDNGEAEKQCFNPFLPLDVYIPDGEPHVFGDHRVYLFGSHDKEDGETYCMLDYVVYSAPIDNLKEWRCEGTIYSAKQDPDYENRKYMYAPDVMQGNDGRYYLYYCMSGEFGQGGYHGPISVAVCDSPAGKYEFLGHVKYADGTVMNDYVCFDPAAMNDNGVCRLYYGTQYNFEERPDFFENEELIQSEMNMFGKSREYILSKAREESAMGAIMLTLENDMLTVAEKPKHIIPYKVKGTDFETHPFYEGPSIRKVGDTYYFIYSSQQNHELCYATSRYPDRDFRFGGTIVSNGDVGFEGRTETDRMNMTGTTHGSIENINGEWYVFYHRLTHKSDYSRQACAEKIAIEADGSIKQVGISSCGLNGGPLRGEGEYPAVIACHITNGNMPHGSNRKYDFAFPHVASRDGERFVSEIGDSTLIGFKYFDFKKEEVQISLKVRGKGTGVFKVMIEDEQVLTEIPVAQPSEAWVDLAASANIPQGVHSVYLRYQGDSTVELKSIAFE